VKKPRLMLVKSATPPVDELTWDELERLIAEPPPHSVPRMITPKIALRILETYNLKNRPPRQQQIRRYMAAMATSGWKFNGATIVFTDNSRLGDGQNRLWACVRSEQAFATHIVFGIPDDSFDTIDAGKARDHADVLTLLGAEFPRDTANGVKWAEWFETNKVKNRPLITPQEIGQLYKNKHKGVEDFIKEARKIARANEQTIGMVAGFLYHVTKIDPDLAADFAEAWSTGTRPPRFYAITQMQTHLASMRKAGAVGGHRHEVIRAAMAVNAWNAAHLDRRLGMPIKWDHSKPFPTFK
jgi:hypothetical protein